MEHMKCASHEWATAYLEILDLAGKETIDKHFSLLRKFINYRIKEYDNISLSGQYYKTVFGIIYATSSIFTQDFD